MAEYQGGHATWRDLRFAGTIINISSRWVFIPGRLYRPSFFSARAPWRFFSFSWPVLVRYPWKPNRGPSVSLMENRRRRADPLDGGVVQLFMHKERSTSMYESHRRASILFVDVNRGLQLSSNNFQVSGIEEIHYVLYRIDKSINLTNKIKST